MTVAAALQPQPVGNLGKFVLHFRLLSKWRPVGNSQVNQVACLAFVSEQHLKSVILSTYEDSGLFLAHEA